jgi:alpha-1,3-fucosyltransferase
VNPFLTKKKLLNSYDADVFYIDAFTETSKMIKDLSKNQERTKRMSSQRYVALRVEPPVDPPVGYSIKKDLLENFFNWSMSYRQDADIQLPYGTIRPLQEREKPGRRWKRIRTMNESKNGSSAIVAWMVSHCSTDSKREDYVKELRKFIDVDIYGKCGNNLKCKSDKINGMSSSECYDMIESKYKFYLSFENSICPDYVTEKFFRIAQLDSVVPVVYGGADYSRIAPPHSYIDARQFEPKKLADYLKKLDADDALFEEYLRWKDHYVVENSREIAIQNAFCDLCRKLHQDDEPMKVYNRVIDWFHPENTCVIDAPE